MTKTMRRNVMIFGFGLVALIGGLLGDRYLRQEKPDIMPSLSSVSFELVSHEGGMITNQELIGKATAIYFGFTWCPDICPTTLSQLADMKAELSNSDDLQLVFLTVDPVRDTPRQMADYISLFDGDIIGITGDDKQISDVVRRFGAFAQKVPSPDGDDDDYLVDHTASVYLYDQKGRFKGTISPAEPYEMALAKMMRLTNSK